MKQYKQTSLLLILVILTFSCSTRNAVVSAPSESAYINFTLENRSVKSIPLLIPSVMNPNLSPFSKSGVSLKI